MTKKFRRDIEREKKGRHRNVLKNSLEAILNKLTKDQTLGKKYVDHPLINNWKDHRNCHVRPDLVLIYKKIDNELILVRLGSHSELGI